MKKALTVLLCLTTVLCFSACSTSGTGVGVTTSSDTSAGETSLLSQSPTSTSKNKKKTSKTTTQQQTTPATKNSSTATKSSTTKPLSSTTTSGSKSTATTTTTQNTPVEEMAYGDIACTPIAGFEQVSFAIQNSSALFNVFIPEDWQLKKSNTGYDIVKNAKTIGRVTASANAYSPNKAVNAFHSQITSQNVKITHSIDRVNATSFTRTLCYNGDDNLNKYKKLILTVNYEELDAAAVYKMMNEAQKATSFTEKNLGVLQIEDNRNRILILGNSFIGTSQIGNILQKMCGSRVTVDAISRGYARVGTYTSDVSVMQSIWDGEYSAVFVCGFFSPTEVAQFEDMVSVCELSDTKLAIFPAHNENRNIIEDAVALYPNATLIDWKGEIDHLIQTGVDYYSFCINDAHQHSTPLAGYVGAHMIYRAILGKIPTATSFDSILPWELDLLGDYVTTGSVTLFDQSSAYLLP